MPPLDLWLTWIGVNALGVLSPGPDLLLVLSRSLSGGSKVGVAAAAGIATGLIGHMVLVSLLLTASAAVSETVFAVVRVVGVCYLAWVGIQLLRAAFSPAERITIERSPTAELSASFRKGLITNVVNVKAAVWFFTVMPQFVRLDEGSVALQVTTLSVTMVLLAFVIFSTVALLAGRFRALLERHPAAARWQEGIAGVIFLVLAIGLGLFSINAAIGPGSENATEPPPAERANSGSLP